MPSPPKRCQIQDFSGATFTLSDSPQQWISLSAGSDVLLLGVGPGNPQELPFVRDCSRVFWLEEPKTLEALQSADHLPDLPKHWHKVTWHEALDLCGQCACWLYRPGLRIAPKFWGPVMGACDASRSHTANRNNATETESGQDLGPVFLPGNNAQLLHPCLHATLQQMGFGPIVTEATPVASGQRLSQAWDALLQGKTPKFVLSVNGRGLDGEGRLFQFFSALHVPVAIWFVDNPWHVLSAWRLPWWKQAHLFVTDASFVAPLEAVGAQQVRHLPLGVAPHMAQHNTARKRQPAQKLHAPLFVGRSTFPGREKFFAASRVPQDMLHRALDLLQNSKAPKDCPHFHWWWQQLHISPWPSQSVRNAGHGAEICALANRTRWLTAGLEHGLQIIGDAGWSNIFPQANILPPVDYYTALPNVYASAQCVLNVTSLLLPHSLSQRHFDVWATGGFLLSDATRGLDIFPEELTAPIMVHGPDALPEMLAKVASNQNWRAELIHAWQECLYTSHTYTHRIKTMLEAML